MRWEYSEWDQTLQDLLKSFQDLMSLFNYLMLMAGGDVDKVFKWMEYLQERGSLDPDVDLAEFRRQLEEQRIIEKLKDGSYSPHRKGGAGHPQGFPEPDLQRPAEVGVRPAPRAQHGQR